MPVSARIGPYRVLRLINHGGQGSVFLGYDTRLHRPVAIKLHRLPEERAGRKRLLREAQLIASLQSAKIVQVYDLVVGQDNIALIMEYVPGCDLEEFLGEASPSVASVLTVATDLAGALAAARQRQIVHGDLKAGNVLVTSSGRVKLTDFGIARAGSDATPGLASTASPSCISPEQYLGRAMDLRSDFFALGCLLYRMLTDRQPFIREGQLDPRVLLEETPPSVDELVSDLPAGLSELIEALLQKDPDDRPQSTQEVRYALRNIARGIPLSVSSVLLEETRAYFREESPGDIPPSIPPDLQRGGRSRLQTFQLDKMSSWTNVLPRVTPLRLAGLSLVGLLTVVTVLRHFDFEETTHIQIPEPVFRVAGAVDLPLGVSPAWLVEQVKEALGAQLGRIFVTGPVGATEIRTLYASPPKSSVDEQLSMALRCSGDICLFSLSRQHGGGEKSHQTIIFSDMSLDEWRSAVRRTTVTLYE